MYTPPSMLQARTTAPKPIKSTKQKQDLRTVLDRISSIYYVDALSGMRSYPGRRGGGFEDPDKYWSKVELGGIIVYSQALCAHIF